MKVQETKKIRNVVLVSHGNAGKTTLLEAILFKKKLIPRMGRVEDGTTVSDYQPEEKSRKFSISLSIVPVEHKGVKINFLDTPGYADFVSEVLSGVRAAENGLMLINAMSGIEIQTKRYWNVLEKEHKPRAIFINKIDVEGIDINHIFDSVRNVFGNKAIPLNFPVFEGGKFVKISSIFEDKTLENFKHELMEVVAESDDALLEKYLGGEELSDAEINSGLKNAYLNGNLYPIFFGSALSQLGVDALLDFVADVMVSPEDIGSVVGVNPSTKEEETRKISKDEFLSAFVFKTLSDPYVGKLSFTKVYSGVLKSNSTIYNSSKSTSEKTGQIVFLSGATQEPVDDVIAGDIAVITKLTATQTNDTLCDKDNPIEFTKIEFPEPMLTRAMRPKTKTDEDRMSIGLSKIVEEDPTVKVSKNLETKEQLISGMGETHLSVIMEKLSGRYGVNIELTTPKVPYRETITTKVKVEGKYKKQTGGHGQYGHCFLEVEPLERGKEYTFESKIFGGAIPKQYIPAVEKGVKEAMEEGILAGYPVTDIGVAVVDGSYHPVDSSELAFKIAGSMALKKALETGNPIILEPIEKLL